MELYSFFNLLRGCFYEPKRKKIRGLPLYTLGTKISGQALLVTSVYHETPFQEAHKEIGHV